MKVHLTDDDVAELKPTNLAAQRIQRFLRSLRTNSFICIVADETDATFRVFTKGTADDIEYIAEHAIGILANEREEG